jgi:hypothetical protein
MKKISQQSGCGIGNAVAMCRPPMGLEQLQSYHLLSSKMENCVAPCIPTAPLWIKHDPRVHMRLLEARD